MASSRRHTLELVISQAVAQLSLVAVLPFITRSFSASDVGLYQLATAIAMTLQPLATLRIEFAIPSQSSNGSVRLLMRKGYVALLLLSTGFWVVAGVAWLAGAAMAGTAAMAGLLLFGLGWTAIDNSKLIRASQSRKLALRNLLAGLLAAGLQLTTALVGANVILLALSLVVSRSIAIAVTRLSFPEDTPGTMPELRPYTFRRMVSSVSSGVVATGTGQVLVLASAYGHSPSASGYVGIAQRVAGAPLTLLGQGLAQAMQSQIAPLIRNNEKGVQKRLWRQILFLSVLATTCAALLIALAPPLAEPILGPGWEPAGKVVAILAVPMAFQLLIGPLMTILPLLGREGLLLITQVVRFVFVAGAVAVGTALHADLYTLAATYGIAAVAGYCGMLAVVITAASRHDRSADSGSRQERQSIQH